MTEQELIKELEDDIYATIGRFLVRHDNDGNLPKIVKQECLNRAVTNIARRYESLKELDRQKEEVDA